MCNGTGVVLGMNLVWGGDKNCEHEWGDTQKNPKADYRTPELKKEQGAKAGTSVNSITWASGDLGNFCIKCGAWKGQLGLEPHPDMYLQHMVEISREIKRVLKDDGCYFLVLGDTFPSRTDFERAQSAEIRRSRNK